MVRCNKCRTGLWPGSAARAAHGLKNGRRISTSTWRLPYSCGTGEAREANDAKSRRPLPELRPVPQEIALRQPGDWLGECVVLEIQRRPRGASRVEPGPTFVATCHGLRYRGFSFVCKAFRPAAGAHTAAHTARHRQSIADGRHLRQPARHRTPAPDPPASPPTTDAR